ncbi:MAG: sensor domain-containing diguanylate cyclase [Negativicutes bacterium]|nr:sensor domain-containing diguanylate cyclase [Negativicutes bacterium]MDR3591881.1 sensor domain-containing diguanylate cyclase [Negativicutes bacterium]
MPGDRPPRREPVADTVDDNATALRLELAASQQQLHREITIGAALAALTKAIISPGVSAEEMYQLVLEQARALTESQHGFVSSIDPTTGAHVGNTLTKMRAEGCSVPAELYALPQDPHKPFSGLWGHALNQRQAFFTNQPSDHSESDGLPSGHLPLERFLAVPVMFGKNLLGQIALANAPRDYTEADLTVVKRLGELYAVVVENRRREEELERLATTDYLTGLWNRRHFMALGQREFIRFQRYETPLTVILIDIDHFKRINDTYGHQAGDGMLSGVAKVIHEQVRTVDIVCRFGGEEFAVILPETALKEALHAAGRIRAAVAAHQLLTITGQRLSVTASIGVAAVLAGDHLIEEAINRADHALYQAKAKGRNQVSPYSLTPIE